MNRTQSTYINNSPEDFISKTRSLISEHQLEYMNGLGIRPIQDNMETKIRRIQEISKTAFQDASETDRDRLLRFENQLDFLKAAVKNPHKGLDELIKTYEFIYMHYFRVEAIKIDDFLNQKPNPTLPSKTTSSTSSSRGNNNNVAQSSESKRYAPSAIHDQTAINALSAEMERIEKEMMRVKNEYLARIASIDTVMRESLALDIEILSAKLEIIKRLQEDPTLDHSKIPTLFSEKLQGVMQDHLVNYWALLKQRDQIMEENQPVSLTEEKRTELLANEKKRVQLIIEKAGQWTIAASSDLNAERKKLHAEFNNLLDTHEMMMKSKTWMSTIVLDLTDIRNRPPEYKALEEQKTALQQKGPATNIWQASEIGDLGYLEDKLREFKQKRTIGDRMKAPLTSAEYAFFNQKNSNGHFPLHLACAHNQLKVVELLLNNQADPNLQDGEGRCALHWTAKVGYVDIGEVLQKQPKFNVNIRCSFDRTPLHYAAYNSNLEMTKFLCKHGADVNAQATKDYKKSPLHDAVMQKAEEVVDYLLSRPKINVDLRDSEGLTPLCHAVQSSLLKVVESLLKNGADTTVLTQRKKKLLQQAVVFDDEKIVSLLLKYKASINAQPEENNKQTALHEAVFKGSQKMVRLLIGQQDLDVNLTDSKGCAAIYYAVEKGELEILTLIVGHQSWKWPTNPSDPNHHSQLLKMISQQKKEQIIKFIQSLPK